MVKALAAGKRVGAGGRRLRRRWQWEMVKARWQREVAKAQADGDGLVQILYIINTCNIDWRCRLEREAIEVCENVSSIHLSGSEDVHP